MRAKASAEQHSALLKLKSQLQSAGIFTFRINALIRSRGEQRGRNSKKRKI